MSWQRLAADVTLILHAAFIAFVLFGLIIIWIGRWRRWGWTQTWTLRVIHLAAIAYVVLQAYVGMVCPLTTLENYLRTHSGQDPYSEAGFIEYWLHRAIFFRAPPWAFTVAYTAFGLLVVATLILMPPRRRQNATQTPALIAGSASA